MRIEGDLAERIARAAMTEPFRQVDVMTTGDLASWLGRRGIDIRWQTLHHLWAAGVLHPIAVLDLALSSIGAPASRFMRIDLGWRAATYLDLGEDLDTFPLLDQSFLTMPGRLADGLLWHPFQLWTFLRLAEVLRVCYSLDQVVVQPSLYTRIADERAQSVPGRLIGFANASAHQDFLRILALLLSAEPLVHLGIHGTIRMSPGESLGGYTAWRRVQDGASFLNLVGLSVPQVTTWHQDLYLLNN